jgi:hypothetical protein
MAKGRDPARGVLALVPFIGLILVVLLEDLTLSDESVGEGSQQDSGMKLVERASDLDYAGSWDAAVAVYEQILQQPEYQEHHEYARNSIKRIHEKQALADGNG